MSRSNESLFSGAMARPLSSQALEVLVGVALAIWTAGEIAFAHSIASSAPWVLSPGLIHFTRAIAAGCLIAAIACKQFDFRLLGILGLFGLVFPALVVWNRGHDAHLIILVLFLLSVRDLDYRRVFRFYAAGVMAGFVVAIVASYPLYDANGVISLDGELMGRAAFSFPGTVACLLFSVLAALALSTKKGSTARKVLLVACIVCAALAFLLLRARRGAILIVILAGCLVADEKMPDTTRAFFDRREVRWFLAALPIVLLCLTNDGTKFFNLGAEDSAFAALVPAYGYAATIGLGVLYVRSVLLRRDGEKQFLVWALFALFALYLSFEKQPMYLEFNCALLLLAGGLGRSILPETDVAAVPEGERAAAREAAASDGELAELRDGEPAEFQKAAMVDTFTGASASDELADDADDMQSAGKHGKRSAAGRESRDGRAAREARDARVSGMFTYAIAGLLLVTLGFTSVQQMRYDRADKDPAIGEITVVVNEGERLVASVDENMKATIGFLNFSMRGTLELVSDDGESQVYTLRDMSIPKTNAAGAVLYVRIPKSGVRGDFYGDWAVYFSCPSREIVRSEWAFTHDDGTVMSGGADDVNVLTTPTDELAELSHNWHWVDGGDQLIIQTPLRERIEGLKRINVAPWIDLAVGLGEFRTWGRG